MVWGPVWSQFLSPGWLRAERPQAINRPGNAWLLLASHSPSKKRSPENVRNTHSSSPFREYAMQFVLALNKLPLVLSSALLLWEKCKAECPSPPKAASQESDPNAQHGWRPGPPLVHLQELNFRPWFWNIKT